MTILLCFGAFLIESRPSASSSNDQFEENNGDA